MKKTILISGSGHARILIDVVNRLGTFEIVGYVDPVNYGSILGVEYLGNDDDLQEIYENDVHTAIIGVGQLDHSRNRSLIAARIKRIGFTFPCIVSDSAIIGTNVSIGEGTQILDGVIVNNNTKIGGFSIINSHATIEHDCEIEDYCHIASGATLSGGVKIGKNSMIGAASVIIQNCEIIDHCTIGAGSVVNRNISEPGTYVGNPARKVND